ncbi:hypothetical protein [uncultured Winogradskyella sp.]|uniref:hypothetical protein n=1 Tax=uncultured Winogradskyella sp. TaxID=395353 RepID=UPI0030ECE33E
MNKFHPKHINTFLMSVFGTTLLWAQDAIVKKDSSNLDVTYFKDGFKDNYSGSDFNYSINDTGGINLIQRVLRKFFNWLGDIFGFDIDWIDYQTLTRCYCIIPFNKILIRKPSKFCI